MFQFLDGLFEGLADGGLEIVCCFGGSYTEADPDGLVMEGGSDTLYRCKVGEELVESCLGRMLGVPSGHPQAR